MALKAVHEKIDEIPEPFRELYTEKDGRWELTGIQGIKTQADIDRMRTGLEKERNEHKETKEKLKQWTDLGELEDVQGRLDKFPELEAASKGKLDEAAIEELAQKRAEAMVRTQMAPVERENKRLKGELENVGKEAETLRGEKKQRTIHDAMRKAIADEKVRTEYHEDALMWADRVMEINDEGAVVTRDNVGVAPGLDPQSFLQEIVSRRPGWVDPPKGGGARGSDRVSGVNYSGPNPWSREGWNLTEQGRVQRERGVEVAKRMAEAAGVPVDAIEPAPVKK